MSTSADRPPRATPLRPQLPGLGTDPAAILARLEAMERLLEGLFVIPGINRPVGLDAIVGLLPVAGDTVTAALGGWIVFEARLLGLPRWKLARMLANVGIDWAIGLLPVVGDALDFLYRSNTMNLRIIRRHVEKHHPELATVTSGAR